MTIYMVDLHTSKGIDRIATRQETKPTDGDKAAKWENKQGQALGLIGMSIVQDLRFHIQDIDAHDGVVKNLNIVFGIKNEIRAHQLENEFLTLAPKNFSSIEDFLSKFKTFRLLLEDCKVKK